MSKLSLVDYQPKRFGVKYNPPMIVLEYLVPSSGKLYHHRMRVRNMKESESDILGRLKDKHFTYLSPTKVTDEQLMSLIRLLKGEQSEVDYDTFDLNKLGPEEVQVHKDKMEGIFRQNSLRPGQPGFQYDKREEFEPEDDDNSWDEGNMDEGDSYDYEDDFEDDF